MQNNVGIYASQISGHLWAPNGAMDALATVTVPSGGVASVEFAGIPQGYKHLQIRYIVRSTQTSTETGINAQFNGDTGSNYAFHYIFGDGASAAAGAGSSATALNLINVPGASATASAFGTGVFDLLDYASLTKNKTVRLLQGWDGNGSGRLNFSSGLWMNSSTAVSSIKFYPSSGNWAQYSQFALYGVK